MVSKGTFEGIWPVKSKYPYVVLKFKNGTKTTIRLLKKIKGNIYKVRIVVKKKIKSSS